MPQSKLVFFAWHPLFALHPCFAFAFFCFASAGYLASAFSWCYFFAAHPLVATHPLAAKFLGVRGYFFSLGILKFRHCERSEAISRNSRILVIAREQSDRSNLVQGLINNT